MVYILATDAQDGLKLLKQSRSHGLGEEISSIEWGRNPQASNYFILYVVSNSKVAQGQSWP